MTAITLVTMLSQYYSGDSLVDKQCVVISYLTRYLTLCRKTGKANYAQRFESQALAKAFIAQLKSAGKQQHSVTKYALLYLLYVVRMLYRWSARVAHVQMCFVGVFIVCVSYCYTGSYSCTLSGNHTSNTEHKCTRA
jgi:hypothetical protein